MEYFRSNDLTPVFGNKHNMQVNEIHGMGTLSESGLYLVLREGYYDKHDSNT